MDVVSRHQLVRRTPHPRQNEVAVLSCGHAVIVRTHNSAKRFVCWRCKYDFEAKSVAVGKESRTPSTGDIAKMIQAAVQEALKQHVAAPPKAEEPKTKTRAGVHLEHRLNGEGFGVCGFAGDTDQDITFVTCARCKDLPEFSKLPTEEKAKGFAAYLASKVGVNDRR